MPRITITLSPLALQRLEAVVSRYNAATGSSLTLTDWIELHLKELAIFDDLVAAHRDLRDRKERELEKEARLLRDQMLSQL